jgi:CheY-like chemotaxis protein
MALYGAEKLPLMTEKKPAILVVDDEIEIRSLIVEFLREIEGYTVYEAENARHALSFLEKQPVELVLSDINMPGMKGFDLLREIRTRYPSTKRVLITAYNVEDYLDLALKYDIGNIFVKTTPFNFNELSTVLSTLLSNNIFGLDNYFNSSAERMHIKITDSKRLDIYASDIINFIGNIPKSKKLQLVIVELLTNAIFYGIRKESAENKENWEHNFTLPDDQAVLVTAAKDKDKYAISVNDSGGRLKKKDVLYWLHRQITQNEKGLPLGLYDSHGRGLFITRKYIDRLIVNIDHTRQTEIIIINYFGESYIGYKPLYINEI